MLDIVTGEDGKFHGYTNTVVGTQCRPFGTHPLSVDICSDALLVEVNLHFWQTVAYHIHVTLQDDRLAILIAGSSSLADNHITHLVDFRLQATALTKVLKILNHLLLTLGRTWDFVNLRKLLEDNSGF